MWHTYLTTIDGRPGLALLDRKFAAASAAEIPQLVWFGVWCQRAPATAFWDPDETEALDDLEDSLHEFCSARGDGWCVYVRRLATHGLREYYFYAAEHIDLAPVLSDLRAKYPHYRVEHDQCLDPAWSHYQRWLREPASPIA